MTSGIAAGNVHFGYAQLEGLWEQAGGPAPAAPLAAAVAMAESSGNSAAYNMDSNGSVDRGLWQINSVHGPQSSYDVMTNARAAVAISNQGKNWNPWTTYRTGAYRQFMQNVPADSNVPINATNAAANQPNQFQLTSAGQQSAQLTGFDWSCVYNPTNWLKCAGGAIGGAASGAASAIFGSIISNVLNPLMELLGGVIGIAGGGILMLFGMFMVVKSTETGQAAIQGGMQLGAMFAGPEGAAVGTTGAERAAAISQQTTRERIAATQAVASQREAGITQRAQARGQRPTTKTRTTTTRRTEGNRTVFETTREQVPVPNQLNSQAEEFRNRR